MRFSASLVIAISLVSACSVSACSSKNPGTPVAANRDSSPTTASTEATAAASSVMGYWTGDWGEMFIAQGDDGVVNGAYAYDDGVVTGTLTGDKFVGRWCELPGSGPMDAGPFEFTLIQANGVSSLDGRWKYDADAPESAWREDWDLEDHTSAAPPEELKTRAEDISSRCAGV